MVLDDTRACRARAFVSDEIYRPSCDRRLATGGLRQATTQAVLSDTALGMGGTWGTSQTSQDNKMQNEAQISQADVDEDE